MRHWIAGIGLGLAVTALGLALGSNISSRLGPEGLRAEAEERLSDAIQSPASIGSLRVNVGFGIGIEIFEIELWRTASGARLRIPRIEARLKLLPLLIGRIRLSRVLVEGPRLSLERSVDGTWTPRLPVSLLPRGNQAPRSELLNPLIALEGAFRSLLEAPLGADHLAVRNGGIHFIDAQTYAQPSPGAVREPVSLLLQGIHGRLSHHRIRGDAQLTLRARVFDGPLERGTIEWEARRARNGTLRVAMTATSLALPVVRPYLHALPPDLRLEGSLSGTIVFATRAPGESRLEIDLIARDVRSQGARSDFGPFGPVFAPRARVLLALEITPERVRLESARIDGVELHLEATGVIERPVELDWFSGPPATFPRGFAGEVEFSGMRVRIGESTWLEGLSGGFAWSEDRVHLRDVRGELDGKPLPKLDLTLAGVSNLFAARAPLDRVQHEAVPLPGFGPLWKVFRSSYGSGAQGGNGGPREQPVRAQLELDLLEHPALLWPIADLRALVELRDHGVHIVAEEGTWGGIPIRGDADWVFEPEPAFSVRLTASPRLSTEAEPAPPPIDPEIPTAIDGEHVWARGRFSIGAIQGPTWFQTAAEGRFRGFDGGVEIVALRVDLFPTGRLDGSVRFDLRNPDLVPCRGSLELTEGDVATLGRQLGMPEGLATGRVDLSGTYRASLRPEQSLLAALEGQFTLRATQGEFRQSAPPMLAIVRESERFNPAARRDRVDYDRIETVLEFSEGHLRTRDFVLDAPDMRVLVEGEVDLAGPSHELRAQVALILFRKLGRVLEKIPILGLLLLGTDNSLMAAYFEIAGPWAEPEAKLVPLRSLATSPPGLVIGGGLLLAELPLRMVKRIQAAIARVEGQAKPPPPPAAPPGFSDDRAETPPSNL